MYRFNRSLAGGTFDRFHLGHQKLLQTAFEQSENVIIGIATGKLFQKKSYAYLIESFTIRKQSVANFLKKSGLIDRSELVPIYDFYGTSLTDKNFDAIFITESNRENVEKINEKRQEKKFVPLEIVIVSYMFGNDGEVISSERIRQGFIDREGNAYMQLFSRKKIFTLPENERAAFRNPLGNIYSDSKDAVLTIDKNVFVIAIGDIVSASLAQISRQAVISIVDGKTRRHALEKNSFSVFGQTKKLHTQNPPGTIAQQAVNTLQKALKNYQITQQKQLVVVSGEEDLLAVPAILLSELNAVVVYGQFDKGVVVLEVTEQNKKIVKNLFEKLQ